MIKFRAWDKVKKVMMVPRDIQTDSDGNIFYVEANSPTGEYDEGGLDIFKLEQFTGLTDVNGKPIYEGDIVKAYRMCKSDLITFANGSFGIAPDYWHSFESFTNFYGKCEVIGNVHQNPELLEEEK